MPHILQRILTGYAFYCMLFFMSESDPFAGWGAKREEQVERSVEAINNGEIRLDIPCEEARHEWFVMAREMYVANNPEPRFPIDLEVGIHMGGCETDDCQTLQTAYWELLKPSHPYAADLLAHTLNALEATIFPNK